jgi:hypothetical protein
MANLRFSLGSLVLSLPNHDFTLPRTFSAPNPSLHLFNGGPQAFAFPIVLAFLTPLFEERLLLSPWIIREQFLVLDKERLGVYLVI